MKKHSYLKLSLLLFLFISALNSADAQSGGKIFRARNKANRGDFEKAKQLYYKALQKDSSNFKANHELGKIYLYDQQVYDSAHFYLDRVINTNQEKVDPFLHFDYANACRLSDQPTRALEHYNIFRNNFEIDKQIDDHTVDSIIQVYRGYCEQAIQLDKSRKDAITVENMDFYINSSEAEYTAIYFENDSALMFNARYKDLKSEKQFADFQYMENIYYFDLEEAVASTYDESVKQASHQAVVNRIGTTDSVLIFYHNVLWTAQVENQRVGDLHELPAELSGFYFQPHGVYNSDQTEFIFSAKSSPFEDLDLFSSSLINGKWTKPEKLNASINSDLDEDSPFLSANDSTLYFSSKGLGSMGEYDIFKSERTAEGWSNVEQLPIPINSSGNDIYFNLDKDENFGYLSSNRLGGLGMMDIYQVSMSPVPTFDCPNFENEPLEYVLDVLESVDSISQDLAYIWRFADYSTAEGVKVERNLRTPGEHKVTIDILDRKAGGTKIAETSETFLLEGLPFIGFHSPLIYKTGDTVRLDAGVSYLEGYNFTNYFWMINDTVMNVDNPVLTLPNLEAGDYPVTVQIFGSRGEGLESFCRTDVIKIRDNIDFEVDTLEFADNNTGNEKVNDKDTSTVVIETQDVDSVIVAEGGQMESIEIEPIFFRFDRTDITKSANGKLMNLISFLAKNPDAKVIISGHTDAMGSESYNMDLAQRRIDATVAFLKGKGIAANRIFKTIAKGEANPLAPNTKADGSDNLEGRKKNRRVEFTVVTGK